MLKTRLDKLEKQTRHKNFLPVLFVNNEKEIELHRAKIGPDTVIFICDFDETDGE